MNGEKKSDDRYPQFIPLDPSDPTGPSMSREKFNRIEAEKYKKIEEVPLAYVVFTLICFVILFWGFFYWYLPNYAFLPPEAPTIAEIERMLDGLVSELPQTLPSIISDDIQPSPDPHYEQGWLVVNQLDWHLAKESRFINEEKLPLQASDVAYVVVISPARKVSAGYWKPQGALGLAEEKFESVYTLYLVDWPNKRLVGKEIVRSSGGSYYESWEEDQDKPRDSILEWLHKRGVVENSKYG